MVDTTIQDKLSRLNYSQHWLDSGVLTENILTEQIRELYLGEDDNTEHYCYRTIYNYFQSQSSFDSNILRHTLRLLESDADKSMAGSATILLLKSNVLTDEQFDAVAHFLIKVFSDWTTKYIDKAQTDKIQKHSSPT